MHLKLYRWFSFILGPLIDLYLIWRKSLGKEDTKRFSERLGHASLPRPSGSLLWVHAASVGEAMSILPLITSITEEFRDLNILVTTGTVTSAKLLEGRLPMRAFHQYVPIDKVITVRRFLSHWRPNLALWVESEFWPNLIIETHKTGCAMIQINARISVPSYEKWQRYPDFAKSMLSCFSLCLAQSADDRDRLINLGATNAKYIGNLKFDSPPLPADPKETGKLISMVGERPLWIAASTHPGENEIVGKIHSTLKQDHENLLTIIIPRHPEKGPEIASTLSEKGLNISLRTASQEINETTDIYIADTIGELGIFYRLSGIVFMGGSLVPHGGQNPLEAARLECALITGPHTNNFLRIYEELEKNEAVIKVKDEAELTSTLGELLVDHEKQRKLASTSLALMESKAGVLDGYLKEMAPYLKPLSTPKTGTKK